MIIINIPNNYFLIVKYFDLKCILFGTNIFHSSDIILYMMRFTLIKRGVNTEKRLQNIPIIKIHIDSKNIILRLSWIYIKSFKIITI